VIWGRKRFERMMCGLAQKETHFYMLRLHVNLYMAKDLSESFQAKNRDIGLDKGII
jgi:hypothetical protein